MSMPGAFSPDLPPFEPDSKKDNQPPDAYSLHTNDPYFDDEVAATSSSSSSAPAHDLPPSYTDEPQDPSSTAKRHPITATTTALLADEAGPSPLLFRKDPVTGAEIHTSRRLDTDPTFFESHITALAELPPRPYVRVRGTHTESVRKRDDKTESKTVVDFDVRLDLTPFLYRDIAARRSWRELRTVDNFQKVCRGTVFPTRAPGFGGSSSSADITGSGSAADRNRQPTLREWCHRYCASHAGLKTFTLFRTVTGFDEDEKLKGRLEDLVRATHYRGHIDISFPVQDARVDVYNTCRVNRWRWNPWVRWLFYLTFLWVFAWPYLFFRTKRFEVVEAEWPFSRRRRDPQTGRVTGREYVTLSELDWYNMWGRAISKAILERRQGELDQRDLRDAEGRQDTSFEEVLAGIEGEATRGLVRAGVSAMNVVNRHFGWGGNC
ncbi:hypothetical protein LY78DRAFT_680802 [Colletotrichum sublineola]|nr:hypothetical protein LY78DRAFT_680802 [Colletotrichum sublineola]